MLRFEKAIYADNFSPGEEFELTDDFEPLTFSIKVDDIRVLRQAKAHQVFFNHFLTTSERRIEDDLINHLGAILVGKHAGWYLLGCRAVMLFQIGPNLSAEFFVMHLASRLQFTLKLEEGALSQQDLRSRFRRIIGELIPERF